MKGDKEIIEDKENLTGKYKFIDGKVIPEPNLFKWAEWFEEAHKKEKTLIKRTIIENIRISSIFLGLDHDFARVARPLPENYQPLIFETMIFDDNKKSKIEDLNNFQERYRTIEETIKRHNELVETVKKFLSWYKKTKKYGGTFEEFLKLQS